MGAGWSFSFPSVQIEDNNGVRNIYFHTGEGDVYKVTGTNDTGNSNLEDYQGNDVKFLEDRGTYVSKDNIPSKFKFIDSDYKTTYFSNDGRLLGIKDRYNNEISFQYQDVQIYERRYPLISRITDTIGRIINFVYSNDNITISVTYPQESTSLQLIYNRSYLSKTSFNGTSTETYNYPVLQYVQDPMGRKTYYENYYEGNSYPSEKFSFYGKDLTNVQSVDRYLLGAISYPASKTLYEYEKVVRNLGPDGATEAYRIKSRYDKSQRYYAPAKEYQWLGDYNKISYGYYGEFTGYPNYASEDVLPITYQFWSEGTSSDGIRIKNIFNGSKQLIQSEATASNKEKKVVKNLEFDTKYKYKPTKTETSEYTNDGSLAKQLYEGITYTDWGGIKTSTLPIKAQDFNDLNIRAKYTTTYSYDNPVFKFFITKTQRYQNSSKLLTEVYSYNQSGKLSNYTNAKGQVTNYNYYNDTNSNHVEEITMKLDNNKTAKKQIVYGSETRYAYPNKIIEYYTNNQGIYTSTQLSKTYNMLLGLVKTETNNENQVTRYNYDNLGRLILVQLPDVHENDNNKTLYSVRQEYTYNEGYNWDYNEGIHNGIYGTTVSSCTYYVNTSNNVTNYYNQNITLYDAYGNIRLEKVWEYGTYE